MDGEHKAWIIMEVDNKEEAAPRKPFAFEIDEPPVVFGSNMAANPQDVNPVSNPMA